MMTTVGNVHTEAIVAHVEKGPFVLPDPEDTYKHLTKRVMFNGITQHAVVVQKDLQQKSLLLDRCFHRDKHDGLRGQQLGWSRRREHQRRGPGHDHYIESAEPCCRKARSVP
eukprot:1776244-Karenia_brevis.AAC.1